jgi:hemerythrin
MTAMIMTAISFEWQPDFELGFAAMDATHREFVECVQALLGSCDAALPEALEQFAAHARSHFDEEHNWMQQTAFPSAQCHLDEHDAVLKSVAEVQALVVQGQLPIARALAAELARWFPHHADSMDASLARWMTQQRLGGAPVLIRRAVKA